MAKTNGSQSSAKKAAFEAAYKAALSGKSLSQGAVNKIYAQELERTKATAKAADVQPAQEAVRSRTKDTVAKAADLTVEALKNRPARLVTDVAKDTRTAKQKYENVQSAYDTYLGSEEYQQKLRDAMKPYLMGNGATASTTPYGAMATYEAQKKELAQKEESKDAKKEELGALAAYYKQQMDAEESARTHEANMKEISAMSDEERAQLEQYIQSRDSRRSVFVNDITWFQDYNKEEQSKKALIEKYGEERLEKLAESYGRHIHEQEATKTVEDAHKAVNQNWMSATFHNLLGLPARALGGVEATVGRLYEQADRTGQYPTLEEYTSGDLLSLYGNTVMSQTAENIAGDEYDESGQQTKDGGFGRELLSYGYQGGMSLLDSLVRSAAGGGAAGGAALAATGAFSQAVSDASRQGATPGQAAAMGIATAGMEYLSEKIPMNEIFKMAKGGDTKLLLAAFKQAGIEISTEELSLFGTLAAEAAILQEKSSYRQQIGELVANGMSYDEAKAQADKAIWEEVMQTAFVSGFSGLLGGAGGAAFGNKAQNNRTQETAQQVAATPQDTATATPEQKLAEMVGAELAQNMPAQPAAQQLTEEQQNVENGIAATLQTAMQGSGQISNKTAEAILNNPVLLQKVMENSGIEMGNTKAEQRKAVKDAVAQMAPNTQLQNRTGNTVAETMSAPAQNDEQATTSTVTKPLESYPAEVKGTGAAEQNFSGRAQYQDLLYEGNVQPDRATDVRPMEVPKTDSYGRNVSEFVANAYGAEITPDRMANDIEMLVQEGALGFDRRSNQESLNEAAAKIEEKGAATIRNQITRNVANGKLQDGDIEKAMLLYASYANKNGKRAQADAAEILVDLTTMAHMTGRNLQLFKLLRKLTPEGQLMAMKQTAQRSVDSMQRAGLVKKDFDVELDPALVEEYRKAAEENARAVTEEQKQESEEKMRETQQAIYAKAAAEMPATFKAKWDAWRYMAMLCNAKTQVRNFGGNAAMIPYKEVKDRMAALFEKAFVSKDQRTKSLLTDPKMVAWAKEDLKTEDVQNALKYSAKIGDDATNAKFREGKTVFDNKVLEAVRKFSEKVPQAGDMLFKNGYYARSLADFLRARGYSVEDVQNGKVSEAVLNEGRSYAVEEAMKATFNDSNAFSDMISSMRFKEADNVWKKAANIAGEGVLPFRRTPANIMVRFAEYSPAGLAKGVWDMATKVRNGDLSAAAALDEIAAGVTGSAAMALGYFLAKGMAGVKLTGGKVDEDEERQGHQKYAIEFMIDGKEYSYKIDWAAPANMPLFVGANIYDMLENAGQDTDVSFITSFIHGMGTMFEPILALSCMSPLNELVEGVRYAGEGEAIYSIAVDLATSYFMQGIPALVRQTYTAMQENKQTTFANSDDPTIRDLQNLGAQIPFVGAMFQTDKRNAWGETEATESGAMRAINAFLNPGTLKQINEDAVEKELTRLSKAQLENVSPRDIPKKVSYTDTKGNEHSNQRLTEDQYQTLAQTQGKTAKTLLDELIATDNYKALTDAQKAAAVNAIYEYAAEHGKVAALPDYKSNADTWIKEAGKDPVGTVIRKYTGKAFDDAMKSMTASWTDKLDASESVEALEAAYTVYSNMSQATRKAVKDDATGRVAAYMEARNNRVSTETFVDLYKQYWELDKSGKKQKDKAEQWAYTLEKAQESGKLTQTQKNVLKETLGFNQTMRVETEKFDELANSGLSAKDTQSVTKAINSLMPKDGKTQVSDAQKWDAIVKASLDEVSTDMAIKAYMTDYDPESSNPDKTELKYDYVRQEMGLDPKAYVKIYNAYTDVKNMDSERLDAIGTTRKDEYFRKWTAAGMTYSQCAELYNLFVTNGKQKIDVAAWYKDRQ